MPDHSRSSHLHRSRKHQHSSLQQIQASYLEPVLYFTGAIVLIIVAKLLHLSLLAPTLGALGLTMLAVSKNLKLSAGVFVSIVCISFMAIVFAWHWVTGYFVAVISSEVTLNPFLFRSGLMEGLILTVLMWVYHRQFKAIQPTMARHWFGKKSYVIFFKLLFYFLLFLLLFWMIAFGILKVQSLTHLNTQDAAIISGALALLASGIPAIIYLSKSSGTGRRSHRHSHHHRDNRSGLQKNSDPDEK